MLIEATQQILIEHDGFISSRIERSLVGMSIVSYVEGENKEAIKKCLIQEQLSIRMILQT